MTMLRYSSSLVLFFGDVFSVSLSNAMINRAFFFFSVLTFNTENRPRRKKEMSENEGFSSSFLSHTYKAPKKNELESSRSSLLCVCSCNTDFYHTGELFRGWGENYVPLQQPPTIKNGRVVYSNVPCACFYYCVVVFVFCCIDVFFSPEKQFSSLDGVCFRRESQRCGVNWIVCKMLMLSERLQRWAHIKFYYFVCDTRRPGMWVDIIPSMLLPYRFNCVCLSIDAFFFFTVYLNICFLMLLCVCLCLPFISQLEG